MSIRAILLDMGGVLLDLEESNGVPGGQLDHRGRLALLRHLAAPRRLTPERLDELVFEPWRQEYGERYRLGREASWKPHLSRLRRAVGSRAHDLELLGAWFAPFADRCDTIDGAVETVRALQGRRIPLALVSNVPLPGALYRRILARHGLDAAFAVHRFSYDCGHRKPSPAMLRSALEELGVAASAAIMVGDRRSSDVAAGRAAGVATVWIRSDHRKGPSADWTIDSIAELPALVEAEAGRG